jgi:hypothetical protein
MTLTTPNIGSPRQHATSFMTPFPVLLVDEAN